MAKKITLQLDEKDVKNIYVSLIMLNRVETSEEAENTSKLRTELRNILCRNSPIDKDETMQYYRDCADYFLNRLTNTQS